MLERRRIAQQLLDGGRHRLHVARGDDAAGLEPADVLAQAADVVGNGRHPGPQGAKQRARLVESGLVGKDRERCVAVRAIDLGLRQVAEPPLGQRARRLLVALHRLHRVACYEQPCTADPLRDLDRVIDALVGPDQAEAEQRVAVVRPGRVGADDRMGNDAQCRRVDAELLERLAAGLAVGHDPPEPPVDGPPHVGPPAGAAVAHVVGRVHQRLPRAQQPAVELGDRHPLHVQDVRGLRPQPSQAQRVLGDLQRHAQPGAAEHARAERVEELLAAIADRIGHLAEPEPRGDQLDIHPQGAQLTAEMVVIVRPAVARRVGDDHAHQAAFGSASRSWTARSSVGRGGEPTRTVRQPSRRPASMSDSESPNTTEWAKSMPGSSR